MAYRLSAFSDIGLDEAFLRLMLREHADGKRPRLHRLWAYYRNGLRAGGLLGETSGGGWGGGGGGGGGGAGSGGWYRQAQEVGLPARIVGGTGRSSGDAGPRREVVIENDIAWRVQSMVDFMFAKPVSLLSTAGEETRRREIERALDEVWEASGGISLFQDMALLGHVYGHVDLVVRVDPASRGVDAVRVEVVEPTRGIPIQDPSDYRRLAGYVIHFERDEIGVREKNGGVAVRAAVNRRKGGGQASAGREERRRSRVTEVFSSSSRQLYHDERLVDEEDLSWAQGRIPVVHVQNISEPFRYEGLGEVEPLIPMQDELNTRLSDRASRVTMQSFKMYLAKGIEGFEKSPVGPGAVWSTDNMGAAIEQFGGDGHSPSESAHIQEVREAMDKISGVPPLASGVVRARIGNLTSANALRITLMGLLSKTARKRVTYGRGIAQVSELILAALDQSGVLRTTPEDRGVRLNWPDPLPEDSRGEVQSAEAKMRLGVSQEQVLSELGYSPSDPGVV